MNLEEYNATIVATAEKPYLYIRNGQRFAFTQKQHDRYIRMYGGLKKLSKLYVIEVLPGHQEKIS